jgi:hypothetical protein
MWFAIRRIRLEREFACDGLALSTLSPDEPPRYGHTIVNLLEKFSQVSYVPSVAGIVEDTSQIERRIKMIAKFKKTSRTRSAGAVLLVAIVACIALTDAYPAELPFTFGTPTNLGPAVNSSDLEWGACTSADGLLLFFARQATWSDSEEWWMVTRTTENSPWDDPVNFGPWADSHVNFAGTGNILSWSTADGLEVYLPDTRAGGYGGLDLWVWKRKTTDEDYSECVNLGQVVNSGYDEVWPSISRDGLELYFCGTFTSPRPGGYGISDIWVTKRATRDAPWAVPMNLGPMVNSAAYDGRPCLSADGLVLFFDSQRVGGYGSSDLYMTRRASRSDPWEKAVNLGAMVNTPAYEEVAYISADGSTLYFDSGRSGGYGGQDIWQVPVFWAPVCGDEDHPYPKGDLNLDCRVDYADLAVLCAHWLEDNNP